MICDSSAECIVVSKRYLNKSQDVHIYEEITTRYRSEYHTILFFFFAKYWAPNKHFISQIVSIHHEQLSNFISVIPFSISLCDINSFVISSLMLVYPIHAIDVGSFYYLFFIFKFSLSFSYQCSRTCNLS